MAAMTDVLIPALEDARDAHAKVVDRFRTDATTTPPGTHRQRLERQIAEAQYHLNRIEDRVREMRPRRGLLAGAGQVMWLVTRGAVRVTMLPLEAGASAVTGVVRGRRPADERRLLRNAEDEYAAAARALATCQAGRDIAEQLHDEETADLLAVLGRQDEQMLETLEENLAQRARALAAATNGHRRPRAEGAGLWDAIRRTVRAAVARLRAVLRRGVKRLRGTAGGAWREVPGATRMAEEVQGAMAREQDLPIAGFSQLGVPELQQRLRGLSQTELTVLEGYERAHAGRPGVLNAIQHLREAEPWSGYDAMDPERIKMHLHDVSPGVARQVLEYERHHRQRDTVINAAESALRTAREAPGMAEERVLGSVTREEELPISGYGRLGITEIRQRLHALSRSDLAVIEDYERTHAGRRTILEAIEQVRGSEPWAGYDTMGPDEIVDRLDRVPPGVARQVLAYERLHQQRRRVITAAQARIPM